jgi:hypothetical protein
MMIRKDNNEE